MKKLLIGSCAAALLAASVISANAAGLGSTFSAVGVAPYNLNANGAAAAASSTPVVQALDQPVSSANTSIPVSVNSSTAVQILAHSGSLVTYITAYDVIVAGAVNASLVSGTGTNCVTGQVALTGAYPLQVAGSGINKGTGQAAVLIAAAGQDICWKPDTAVQISGSLTYQRR